MRVVHWMKSDTGINPFRGIQYAEGSSNTGGCGSDNRVEGVWVVPDGRLSNMWCCDAVKAYKAGAFSMSARDIQIVAEVPAERLRAFRMGTERPDFIGRPRKTSLHDALTALCIDDDNGLVIDRILPEEIISVRLGIKTMTIDPNHPRDPIWGTELVDLTEDFFV